MTTEDLDPRFSDIDCWPTDRAIEAMLAEQVAALASIRSQIGAIAAAADAAVARIGTTGRIVYAGAGTSGRIAVQDGVELEPTYGWPQDRLAFLMAGGPSALTESAEGAEDDAEAARIAVAEAGVGPADVVIGIAASGRTPYTIAVLQAARAAGALTIAVSNNPGTRLLDVAAHPIVADTGAEVVAGSTRMKAGSAQKAILNMLSTAIMLRAGLVYRGLMVSMRVSNDKLRKRAEGIVQALAGGDAAAAAVALEQGRLDIRAAVLIGGGLSPAEAERLLRETGGNLREAIARRDASERDDA